MKPDSATGPPRPGWRAFGLSDQGRQRANNEDVVYCDAQGVFLVVDGIGGEAAGEVAAKTAAEVIARRLAEKTGTAEQRIREAIWAANQEILRLAEDRPDWRGMACVLTVALLEDGHVHVGHVGDTRLYELHDEHIRKITRDHSPIGVREDAGELDELAAMRHPRRNEVFRDVGSTVRHPDDGDFIELHRIPFAEDCALVLCSDGLTDLVTTETIRKTVHRHAGNPEGAVRELIALANQEGGKDNVSVIVVQGDRFDAVGGHGFSRSPTGESLERVARPGGPARTAGDWRRWVVPVVSGLAGFALGISMLMLSEGWESIKRSPSITSATVASTGGVLHVPAGASIGAALAKAKAGDVITVAEGVYKEALTLRNGVSIVAEKPGKVVVWIDALPAGEEAAVKAEGLQSARLEGLAIRAAPTANVSVGVSVMKSRLDVVSVRVTGMQDAGLWIGQDSAVLVTRSEISENKDIGILVTDKSHAWLFGNDIHTNGFGGSLGSGIWVGTSSTVEMGGNIIGHNRVGMMVPADAHTWIRRLTERNLVRQPTGSEVQVRE